MQGWFRCKVLLTYSFSGAQKHYCAERELSYALQKVLLQEAIFEKLKKTEHGQIFGWHLS